MAKMEIKFVNPWIQGVSYEAFLNAIPKGVTVKEYLTGKLGVENENELIDWLESEIKIYKENKQ